MATIEDVDVVDDLPFLIIDHRRIDIVGVGLHMAIEDELVDGNRLGHRIDGLGLEPTQVVQQRKAFIRPALQVATQRVALDDIDGHVRQATHITRIGRLAVIIISALINSALIALLSLSRFQDVFQLVHDPVQIIRGRRVVYACHHRIVVQIVGVLRR